MARDTARDSRTTVGGRLGRVPMGLVGLRVCAVLWRRSCNRALGAHGPNNAGGVLRPRKRPNCCHHPPEVGRPTSTGPNAAANG
eukprot:934997-Lingulodinium_polyedra.AAC.1